MATVNLGSIKFKWKGTYAGGTAYTIDDVVSYNGSSYICILASTGNLPTNATYFEQMSSAGTNGTDGTDLTSTLTTQGDLIYRDGSGLQRLGAGTSGQVLQTGGTGANPSWGTVSSDMVKVASATGGSGTTIAIDSCFSADYENYLIIGNFHTDGNSSPYVRLQNSSNTEQNSDYYYVGKQIANNQSQSEDIKHGWSVNAYSTQEGNEAGSDNFSQFTIWVNKPFVSSTYTFMQMFYNTFDGSALRYVHSIAQHRVVQSNAGIRFTTSGGHDFTSPTTVKVYGIK